MKKIRAGTFGILAFVLMASVGYATEASFYLMDVSPGHVEPGETTTLNITLKNLGTNFAVNLRANLDPNDVSPIDPIGTSQKYITKKAKGAKDTTYFGLVRQGDEINLAYNINVKPNTPERVYYSPLVLTWEDATLTTKSATIMLGTQVGGTPNPIIADVNTTPSRIYADSDFTLVLQIENMGSGRAKSVKAELLLPAEFSGETSAMLGSIETNGVSHAAYNLKVSKEAVNKSYDFTLRLSYVNEAGIEYEVERDFQLYVSEMRNIDLEIAGLYTSPRKISPGSDFELSLQIENIGKQDAKTVKVDIVPPEGFSGDTTYFVGTLEQGDSATATFDLSSSDGIDAKPYDFGTTFSYVNEKGDRNTKKDSFEIVVVESNGKFLVPTAAILIILLILVIFRRKQKSSKKGRQENA